MNDVFSQTADGSIEGFSSCFHHESNSLVDAPIYSENLIKAQAQMMVSKGFLKAGYEYIIVDDCWLSHERDSNGELQPDPKRFPSGMKALGDYVRELSS